MKIIHVASPLVAVSFLAFAVTGSAAVAGGPKAAGDGSMVSPKAFAQLSVAAQSSEADAIVDANDNMRVPNNYRIDYQFLGSWAVPAARGRNKST